MSCCKLIASNLLRPGSLSNQLLTSYNAERSTNTKCLVRGRKRLLSFCQVQSKRSKKYFSLGVRGKQKASLRFRSKRSTTTAKGQKPRAKLFARTWKRKTEKRNATESRNRSTRAVSGKSGQERWVERWVEGEARRGLETGRVLPMMKMSPRSNANVEKQDSRLSG